MLRKISFIVQYVNFAVMKKIFCLLFIMSLVSSVSFCQNIANLENNHRFKNVTIGMPISDLNRKLEFVRSTNGFDVYKSTDSNLYSVFNVKMDLVLIIVKASKVYAIEVSKTYKASEQPNKATIFTSKELEVLESGLTSQYGNATHKIDDNNSKYTRFGVQWQSQSYLANCYIDFYGTLVGYKVQFSLCKHEVDF